MGMIIIVPRSWRCFECQWVHLCKVLGEQCLVWHIVSTTKYRLCVSHSVMFWLFATPWTVPARLLCPWNSSGKNTGVDSHSLLQGIFLTQGSNPGFLHCREILYYRSHQRSPSYYHFHLLFENHIWHRTTICYFANLFRTGTLLWPSG